MLDAVDVLVGLVALAGDQHDVARTRHRDRLFDGGLAVTHHDGGCGIAEAGHDLRRDHVAILAARVVVGDDGHVAQTLGNRTHERPLANVALATAAEHAQHARIGVRAQRRQGLLECIRGVCVIDDDQWCCITAEAVHASMDGLQLRQGVGDASRVMALRMQHAGDHQQVVDVEATQQARVHTHCRCIDGQFEREPRSVELHVGSPDQRGGITARTHRDHAWMRRVGQGIAQLRSKRVVDVDHGRTQSRPREQPGLGRAVGGHVTVVIEVVAREVGERGDVEMHAIGPTLIERMRADFHRDALRACIDHAGQQCVQMQHERRRETGRLQVAMQPGAQRAAAAGADAQQLPCLHQQLHGGGLAIGAGDADNGNARGHAVMERIGQRAKPRAQVRHGDGVRGERQVARRIGIEQDRRRAMRARLLDEGEAMRAEARDRDKGIAGPHVTRIHRQATDHQSRRDAAHVGQQRCKGFRARHRVGPGSTAAATGGITR